MVLKENVRLDFGKSVVVSLDEKQITADPSDCYIFLAMEKGMTENEDFIKLVMDKECTDEISAGFRMTQFVIDYGEFISNDRDVVY